MSRWPSPSASTPASALYLDQPGDVTDYMTVMDRLCVEAGTGTAGNDILSALLKQT